MQKAKEKPMRAMKELSGMRLYTLAELEPVLGISQATLKKYVKERKLKAAYIGGKWRVTAANLQQFLDEKSDFDSSEISNLSSKRAPARGKKKDDEFIEMFPEKGDDEK